jgi:ABC-type lipoprotein release transport system permease subunit
MDVAIVFGAALLMAIVSSYLPARRINGIDPAMVFRA